MLLWIAILGVEMAAKYKKENSKEIVYTAAAASSSSSAIRVNVTANLRGLHCKNDRIMFV